MNFKSAYPDIWHYGWLLQRHIDWLTSSGVSMEAIIRPHPIRLAHGYKAADGRFEPDPSGPDWFVFAERDDLIFWRPRTGELATWNGRSFALGQEAIGNASTYAFNFALHIFENPLDWLRAGRDGIVIADWRCAFDRLRDCPRIITPETLYDTYERHMRPRRMPAVFVLRERKGAAA